MMNYEEFKQAVADQILDYLPEEYANATVTLQSVVKNNGTNLTGVIVKKPEDNCSPNVYLESFFNKMQDEELSFDEIMRQIAKARVDAQMGYFDVDQIMSWDAVKDRIKPRLINKSRNKESLQQRPYMTFAENLAVIYAVDLGNAKTGSGKMSTAVTTNLADKWNVTVDIIDETARKNISGQGEFLSMEEMLFGMAGNFLGEAPGESGMYVLSNKDRINGAAELLDTDVLDGIADRLGGDFTILPSSIHEVIILPQSVAGDGDGLRDLVGQVNDSEVASDEVLSYSVYRYDSATKRVVLTA